MELTRRALLQSVSALALVSEADAAFFQGQTHKIAGGGGSGVPAGWSEMLVGPGGYIQHAMFANDGTCVIVTDTGNAAIGNAIAGTRWAYTPVASSLPSFLQVYNGPLSVNSVKPNSVYALAIAPSHSQYLLMVAAGYTFASTNQGQTYNQVPTSSVPQDTTLYTNQNGNYGSGPLVNFDPQNSRVMVVGLPGQGVYYSLNAGSTWTKLSGIAASTLTSSSLGRYVIEFDRSSSVSGGQTQRVFVGVYGTGVYKSETGLGGAFSLLSGSPTNVCQMACSSDGYLAVVTGADRNIWMWNGSSGTTLTPANPNGEGNSISCCAWDPNTSGRIVAAATDGTLNVSLNHGTTFTGWTTFGGLRFTTGDGIPWLATANGPNYMTLAAIAFDPSQSNVLMGVAGIGVYLINPLNNYASSNITWESSSLGIEQLTTNKVVSTPDGSLYVVSWDRPLFKINNSTYPTDYQPSSLHGGIAAGWDLDYCATNTSLIVGAIQGPYSGYSTDKLTGWNQFASNPNNTGASGGLIAVDASGAYIVYISVDYTSTPGQGGSNVGQVQYSSNLGASWATATMTPSQPTTTPSGWGSNTFQPHTLTSDKVNSGTFYALNYVNWVYKSTDGGQTWTQQNSTTFNSYNLSRARMRANPLVASDLWATPGTQFNPANAPSNTPFFHSTDGGVTWTIPNANVKEVICVGFGAIKPGQRYATIWIVGWVSGVFGIWRSLDEGVTWTQMSDETYGVFPRGILDTINCLEGDMTNYALVYGGFSGTGYFRGNFA